ncbi:MAG TPA: class I SAM-dependent methyltransferase [Chitinophagaceae bacterium]
MTYKLFRVRLQHFFRVTGLLAFVENVRFYQKGMAYQKSNKMFLKENPDFALPPAHLAFDAYNAPKWKFYKYSGEETAKFIREIAGKYLEDQSHATIYEWGCGPGRVIRHLPAVFDSTVKIMGSDYNEASVAWCQKNIPGIRFFNNGLYPPLALDDNTCDMIYSISVFTHLSEETGLKWLQELNRILKPGGLLLFTTLGEHSYNTELLPSEKKLYNKKGIVVRGQYKEGKKMFLTIHNPDYVKENLLKEFEILEHKFAGVPHIFQECWIVRKKYP